MNILQEIRSKTSIVHHRLEKNSAISQVLKESLNNHQYLKILKKFYGFIVPIELEIAQLSSLSAFLPDLEKRYKTHLLQKDLDYLSSENLTTIQYCENRPSIKTLEEAFGYLYVLEGSTLGGKAISENLLDRLNMNAQSGAAYFNNYEDNRGLMWKNFIHHFNHYSTVAKNPESITSSALDTFLKLETWINQQ